MEGENDAHEAWVASLPAPAEAPLTPEQQERAAMLQRRRSFMRDLRDGNVEEDVIAAASRANIFVDYN